jgi:putative addiction module killer protein
MALAYRIYFAEQEKTIVLLLTGGNKKTQCKDIEKAKQYWNEFKERYYD